MKKKPTSLKSTIILFTYISFSFRQCMFGGTPRMSWCHSITLPTVGCYWKHLGALRISFNSSWMVMVGPVLQGSSSRKPQICFICTSYRHHITENQQRLNTLNIPADFGFQGFSVVRNAAHNVHMLHTY